MSDNKCTLFTALGEHHRFEKGIWSNHISSKMTSGQRDNLLRDADNSFARVSGQPALLSNAKCLGEGVDVPSIDGIAFIDPKRSQLDIVQAVGRAIRKSDEDKIGTIVMPVFVNPSEDSEKVLNQSDFKDVWAVINALRDHDYDLAERIDYIRTSLGVGGTKVIDIPDKIKSHTFLNINGFLT